MHLSAGRNRHGVLFCPIPDIGTFNASNSSASNSNISDILDYRKNILAVIVSVFGAWIGAGAAYHFGRENMKEATSSMLQMREPSAKERLRRTPIREMPLKPLDWRVTADEDLGPVVEKLKKEPTYWFVPILKKDGTLETVINEEAVWRFMDSEYAKDPPTPYAKILKKKVSDMRKYIKNEKLERFEGIYIPVTLDKSAGDVHELMQNKGVFLAIVLDETGKPTHFFTTADVRKVLLQMS